MKSLMMTGGGLIALLGVSLLPMDDAANLETTASAQKKKPAANRRATKGLVALYDFQATRGTLVKDRVGGGGDLRVNDKDAVTRTKGALTIRKNTVIRSTRPPAKLIAALKKSNAITVEAWVQPANTKQTGPARIVSLSKNTSERNFTLGQERNKYEFRLRTARTSKNGTPALSSNSGAASTKLTHIVYSRDNRRRARLFINGKLNSDRRTFGKFNNWGSSYRLTLGNEVTGERSWLGTFYLVAIYSRELTTEEIAGNFRAGPGVGAKELLLARRRARLNEKLFTDRVVPLLARRCLECHGWKSKKGKLDLTRKFTAMRGGEGGKVILPGNAEKSPLYQSIKSHDMPKNRTPLSNIEKQVFKVWIDRGAHWPLRYIDEETYAVKRDASANYLRRLTVTEYINTVRDTVGVDIAKEARETLPRDLRADGFSNTAYNLGVDLGHVRAYSNLAEKIVAKINVAKFAGRFSKSRAFSDANLRTLIAGMGKWLLRGPLTKREVDHFMKIPQAVRKEKGTFNEAAAFVIEAMLQAPRFVYRMEIQQGNGELRPAGEYELASRLSYILWGTSPDAELMRAAEAGELSDPKKAAAQVKRMLADKRAVARSSHFIVEWLNLNRLDNLRPNAKRFPKWDQKLAGDMRAETLAFFEEIAWKQNRPLSDLFNAQVTFLTPRLAKHYGVPPGAAGGLAPNQSRRAAAGGLPRYNLKNINSRGGLLTHGSVLTIGGDEASMVTRGLFVLHNLLDGEVEDPPPCVDTTPVPTKPGLSQRGVALARIANKACGGCHSRFEPLAFGLEKFDGLGSFHNVDHHGNKLRDDGEILFPGSPKPVGYKSSAELMNLLAKSDRVRHTLTQKITQWALGRPLRKEDKPIFERVHQAAWRNGGRYRDIMTAIVMSDLVRKTRTEKPKAVRRKYSK